MSERDDMNPLPELGDAFQAAMVPEERHQRGAHYTRSAQILNIVGPTLRQPFLDRIHNATTEQEVRTVLHAIRTHRVLDPTCGCGHFLFIAFQTLRQLEDTVLARLQDRSLKGLRPEVGLHQLFGIDVDSGALAIAGRVLQHAVAAFGGQDTLPHLIEADALFHPWPDVDTIMGNPPFQSKNKRQQVWGAAATERLKAAFPDIPGRADYCVYFLRKAHDQLRSQQRAGFVGTNTIRENDSRKGGLDYIVANGGTIIEAISNQRWEGDAAVYVSIVNWVKGTADGPFRLSWETADGRWHTEEVSKIPASLRAETDVTSAHPLQANQTPKVVFQGQTHGHPGFLITESLKSRWLNQYPAVASWIHPFLNGKELLSNEVIAPTRYVIDFANEPEATVHQFPELYAHLQATVHPTRERKAREEHARNLQRTSRRASNQHHANFYRKWWQLSYRRTPLLNNLIALSQYIACSRVSRFPVFRFVPTHIRPSDAITVFCLNDPYSLGILQSNIHCQWFASRCSTLGIGLRYTSKTVFDSFPWPQSPTPAAIHAVEDAVAHLIAVREAEMRTVSPLTKLYTAPPQELQSAHAALDSAVLRAYGFSDDCDVLAALLALNAACRSRESAGKTVRGPGKPVF